MNLTNVAPGRSARQSTLREANLALVARSVCAHAPVSRADVAAYTQLTRSTVSRLVDDLVAGGVLSELAPRTASGPGRPAIPLLPGSRYAALGLQVNAGFLAARLVDLSGTVLGERFVEADLVESDPALALAQLDDLAMEVLAGAPQLCGAGVAVPGIVDGRDGRLLRAPNLGWSDIRLADHLPLLAQALRTRGLTLDVGNEANLAAQTVAETTPGRPGPLTDFVYLSGEIGIGGAIVLGGAVMAGPHGLAGEIGHVSVDPAGPACRCGSTGCLEQYAGRRALLAAAGLPWEGSPTGVLPDVTALATAAASGSQQARTALDRASWALATALADVVNVLDVPTIVLGGHLGQIAETIRHDLSNRLNERVLSSRWHDVTIETADVDDAAGAKGAAYVALRRVLDHPAVWID